MKEEPTMAETEQGDPVSVEGEADAEKTVKNSPVKGGRGRPHGSKNKTVSASDLLQDSEDPNGPPRRRRGRPKGHKTKPTEPSESRGEQAEIAVSAHRGRGRPKGSKNRRSTDFGTKRELSLRKRGRPKGSGAIRRPAANDLLNGGSDARKRGRPKGSLKRKTESLTSKEKDEGGCPRKRGRPKGARNKRSRMEREYSDWDAEAYRMQRLLKTVRHRPRKPLAKFSSGASRTVSTKAHRGRGRPRKDPDLSQPAKRGRGRPKGSLNKNPSSLKAHGTLENPHKTSGRPTKGRRPGRPRLQSGKRGRPRKYPLPPPEELRKPKVWKRLGRPRKYPREDQLQEASSAPRRGRGRPRKSESKKGAHLRKNTAATPSTQRAAGPQGKKGRPGRDNGAVRKRGRPKGSLNKNKLRGDETLQNHSVAQGGCPAVGTGTGQELMETGETEGTVPGASLDISESA